MTLSRTAGIDDVEGVKGDGDADASEVVDAGFDVITLARPNINSLA